MTPNARYVARRIASGRGVIWACSPSGKELLTRDADWGSTDFDVVITASELLVHATGDPDAALTAWEFMADVLRTLPHDGWILSAEQVRIWYREELADLKADAEADYVVETNITEKSK